MTVKNVHRGVWMASFIVAVSSERDIGHGCLVVPNGRVGSHWLLSLVGQHPEIFVAGEALSNNFDGVCDGCGPNGTIAGVYAYLDAEARKMGRRYSFFKNDGWKYDTDFSEFVKNDCRLIYLWREDYLSIHLSRLAAMMTGQWVHQNPSTPQFFSIHDNLWRNTSRSQEDITVNASDYIVANNLYRQTVMTHMKALLEHRRSDTYLVVEYAEMKLTPHETMRRIFTFLGLRDFHVDLDHGTLQIHNVNPIEYIQNKKSLCTDLWDRGFLSERSVVEGCAQYI